MNRSIVIFSSFKKWKHFLFHFCVTLHYTNYISLTLVLDIDVKIFNYSEGILLMKKILSAVLTAALIFTPVGSVVFQDQPTTVEAKSYKSGKKSFNRNNNSTNNNSLFQKKQDNNTTTNKSAATNKQGGFFSGGLMKGLMLGGLAGLLFGGLFGGMGFLGEILGLFINILAIVVIIALIRKIFQFFTKKKEEEKNPWRN